MMNVLVTGRTGFLGANLAPSPQAGAWGHATSAGFDFTGAYP